MSINDSSYMLKKIIKTHTTKLGVVDIIKPTFLRNAVATNRQRRVIASIIKCISAHFYIPEALNIMVYVKRTPFDSLFSTWGAIHLRTLSLLIVP